MYVLLFINQAAFIQIPQYGSGKLSGYFHVPVLILPVLCSLTEP